MTRSKPKHYPCWFPCTAKKAFSVSELMKLIAKLVWDLVLTDLLTKLHMYNYIFRFPAYIWRIVLSAKPVDPITLKRPHTGLLRHACAFMKQSHRAFVQDLTGINAYVYTISALNCFFFKADLWNLEAQDWKRMVVIGEVLISKMGLCQILLIGGGGYSKVVYKENKSIIENKVIIGRRL